MSHNQERNFEEKSKRFLQLTNHILMEYVYVGAPSDMGDHNDDLSFDYDKNIYTGSVGDGSVTKYCVVENGYVGERYLVFASDADWKTGNGFSSTVLPTNKGCTKWVGFEQQETSGTLSYYSQFNNKWCQNIDGTPFSDPLACEAQESGKNVYDVVRLYFQSGYVPEYDGFVVNFFSRSRNRVYFNYISRLLKNTDSLWMLPEPMWHADKIYTNYIEFRVPSTGWFSDTWNESLPYNPETLFNPLVQNLTFGAGVTSSPSIGVELHGVVSEESDYGYTVYCTTPVTSTLLPCRETNEGIGVDIETTRDDGGDYITLVSYCDNQQENPYSLFDYLDAYGNTFTFVHQVTITEIRANGQNDVERVSHDPVTFIQTWEMLQKCKDLEKSPHPVFRPVLEHTEDDWGAVATYVLRITNNRDGSSIIRECTKQIPDFKKYGKNLVAIDPTLLGKPIRIYNIIENKAGLSVLGTSNPIGKLTDGNTVKINKYVVSSFIDKRNIKVRVSPVKIENVE